MLVKELVNSASLSQRPFVVLPFSFLSKLDGVPLEVQPRNPLPERSVKEQLGSYHIKEITMKFGSLPSLLTVIHCFESSNGTRRQTNSKS